jgi:hypothetical protein
MSLGGKAAIVFLLMVAVGALMILARRRNYEGVRRHYTTRRTRVPVETKEAPPPDEDR